MREFFGGWKRKLGVVTLLMACVSAAGWLRSTTKIDVCYFRGLSAEWKWMLLSGGQKFYVMRAANVSTLTYDVGNETEAMLILQDRRSSLEGAYWSQPGSVNRVPGIFSSDQDKHPIASMIPYWSVTIPLTLMSAWLLLSKPRTRQAKPASESYA